MNSWQYTFLVAILLLVIYHLSPPIQLYCKTRWTRMQDTLHDRRYEIPKWALPQSDVVSHYEKRGRLRHRWGGPTRDGPDRNMPSDCRWIKGMLWCRDHV